MISNITNQISSVDSEVASSKETTMNGGFVKLLSDMLISDEMPEFHQCCLGLSTSEMCSTCLVNGVEVEDDRVSAMDIRASIKQDLDNFRSMLGIALDEAGLSKDLSFEIKCDTAGKIYMNSDHPEKNRIEVILNETPSLSNTLNRISSFIVSACCKGVFRIY